MKWENGKIDCVLYQYAFDRWLNAQIPEGEYSKAAENIFASHGDPYKAFRRRKNDGTAWKFIDLCCLACYLKISLCKMMDEIGVIYKTIESELPAKKNRG